MRDKCGGRSTDGRKGAQIELDDGDVDRWQSLLDFGDGGLGRGARASRDEDGGGLVEGKLLDGLGAEARIA